MAESPLSPDETPPHPSDPVPVEPASPEEQDPWVQKLQELQRTADQCRDQLLRKAAEFENYKRRSEADFANLIRSANEALVSSLLPVLDDLVRSLKAGKDSADTGSFYRGVELISAKLLKTLESQGLAAFESVGRPFDVEYHDALLQVPRDDVPPHTVVEEIERGYKFKDRVLRHARVVVSSTPEETGSLNEAPAKPPDAGTDA
jgi:molecular chaperone GrpE